MRASLFLSSRKMPIWTAKTIRATTRAPRNALRLIPAKPWALPALPSGSSDGDCAAAATELVAEDTNEVALVARLEVSVDDIFECVARRQAVGRE